jgi:hypothetical protein
MTLFVSAGLVVRLGLAAGVRTPGARRPCRILLSSAGIGSYASTCFSSCLTFFPGWRILAFIFSARMVRSASQSEYDHAGAHGHDILMVSF